MYNGRWNTNELNQNDYNESGEIKFFIENWIFQMYPFTWWLPRHKLVRQTQRLWFRILQSDYNTGLFSFKQTTKFLPKVQFGISVIAVRKQTQNLNITYTSSLLSFLPGLRSHFGRGAIRELCSTWTTRTIEIVKPDDLESCPCTLESARMNPNLHVDFTCSSIQPDCHENLNAHRCFLKRIKYVYAYIHAFISVLYYYINVHAQSTMYVCTVPPDLNLTLARVQCTTAPQLSSNTREQS